MGRRHPVQASDLTDDNRLSGAPRTPPCIVISTTWRELLRPFSAFMQFAEYDCSGLTPVVDGQGRISRFEKVEALPTPLLRGLTGQQELLLFSTAADRTGPSTPTCRRSLKWPALTSWASASTILCHRRRSGTPTCSTWRSVRSTNTIRARPSLRTTTTTLTVPGS